MGERGGASACGRFSRSIFCVLVLGKAFSGIRIMIEIPWVGLLLGFCFFGRWAFGGKGLEGKRMEGFKAKARTVRLHILIW